MRRVRGRTLAASIVATALALAGGTRWEPFRPAPAHAQEVPDVSVSSFRMADGRRGLRHSGVVDAPVDSVWAVFTTSAGLRSFMAPRAWLDFGIDGAWEASYDPKASKGDSTNIVNEILSYLPGRMLSIRVRRPPAGFPYPDAVRKLWTVIEMKPLDEAHTWVTATMLGYGAGEAMEKLYGFFESGNATVLANLQARFSTGPVDWSRPESGATGG